MPEKDVPKEEDPQINVPRKTQETRKESIQVENTSPLFSLENEISKAKISMPFSELL